MAERSQIAVYLEEQRGRLRLSQRRLGKLAGLSEGTVANIERGDVRPTPETLIALAGVLKAPPGKLMEMAGYVSHGEEAGDDSFSEEEQEVVRLVRQLPYETRENFLRVLRDMAAAFESRRDSAEP